eukprot:201689_1
MGNQITRHQLNKAKKKKQYSQFIVEFAHHYEPSQSGSQTTYIANDERRVAFVSVVGLFHTYCKCSPHLLYHSLFILPMKRNWLHDIREYIHFMQTSCSVSASSADVVQFWRLLMWKDSQNLLFYMLDEYEQAESSFTHPFWSYLSEQLCRLYNPMTRRNYEPLQLTSSWETRHHNDPDAFATINELWFLTMKFQTMQEIISQSNPMGLNVVTFYPKTSANCRFRKVIMDEIEGEWFISDEYEQ